MVKQIHFQIDYSENIFYVSYSKVSTSEDWTINFYQIQKFDGILHPERLQWNLQKLKKVWLKKYTQPPHPFNYHFVLIGSDFSLSYRGIGNSVSKSHRTQHRYAPLY